MGPNVASIEPGQRSRGNEDVLGQFCWTIYSSLFLQSSLVVTACREWWATTLTTLSNSKLSQIGLNIEWMSKNVSLFWKVYSSLWVKSFFFTSLQSFLVTTACREWWATILSTMSNSKLSQMLTTCCPILISEYSSLLQKETFLAVSSWSIASPAVVRLMGNYIESIE